MSRSEDSHTLAERIATSVRDQLDDGSKSRRSFLARTALAGGTLLAIGGGTGIAFAQNGDDDETDTPTDAEMAAMFDDVGGTDLDVINYALTLERVADAFYTQAFETFTEEDFVDADPLQSFGQEYRRSAFGYLESVAEHEAAHVELLTEASELVGGDPSEERGYTFDIESVNQFLELGRRLETTGVAAYAGAAPFIESPDLLSATLSIHSVEARHAALLNELNGEPPAPNAFDQPLSQAEVLDVLRQYFDTDPGDGTTTPMPETETTPAPETETMTPAPGTETTTTPTFENETTTSPPLNGTTTTTDSGNQ